MSQNSTQFRIVVNNIQTVESVNGLDNVIRTVFFQIFGAKGGIEVGIPKNIRLPNPADQSNFIPFSQVSESDVISWIESNMPNLTNIKQHIEEMLDKQLAQEILVEKSLPWAPKPNVTL